MTDAPAEAPTDTPAEALTGIPVDASGMPDALESLGRWRLRPGVTATALARGLHLRGWSSSVTLEGSPALPALWGMVEEALRTDGGAARLAAGAGAGTPLRAALCTLIGQVHAHGMLVEDAAPPGDGPGDRTGSAPGGAPAGGPADDWLFSVADRPAGAAAVLRRARVEVRTAEPGEALAAAVLRALARAGVAATRAGAPAGAGGRVLLSAVLADAAGPAVGAAVHPGGAFVTPVGSRASAEADAAALGERLGLGKAPGPGAVVTPALTALVAGGAVQRLLAAVAGLPDPGAEDTDPDTGPDPVPGPRPRIPVALVAADRPPQAAYRPWPGAARDPASPPGTLAEALAGVAALGDERLGVLPAPLTGSLPQLPVALAACAAPGGGLLTAGAVRADLARLDALCRAAELRLGAGGSGVVVGAGPGHALGRALRRAALDRPLPVAPAAPWEPDGSGHAQARHWWATLTRRLGVRAELSVTALDAGGGGGGGVHRAVVRESAAPGRRVLGQAVEATAGDAVAFATLAALVRVQAEAEAQPSVTVTASASASEGSVRHLSAPGGEVCPLAVAGVPLAPWEDESWAAGWWARVAGREAALHTALRGLTGLRTGPWEADGPDGRAVLAALRGCGFTVLATGTDTRTGTGTNTSTATATERESR
ncbi:hypothetical protein [Streptomyces sp. NPDC051567]|uniref:hypothetical protein n=1 Tax=Streptomyces sp. NPDC051567 TaxID=3365660 RepID=UPI0037957E01